MKGCSLILALALLVSPALAQDAADDASAISQEEIDPVDLNRAGLEDLLELPGMDADLARAILAWRREKGPFDSVEALYASPAITPSRLAEVLPWLTAAPVSRTGIELGGAVRTAGSGLPLRREARGVFHTGGLGMAARARLGWKPDTAGSGPAEITAALRWRPARAILFALGDQAPVEGAGLLVGLSTRPVLAGVRVPAPEGGGDGRAPGSGPDRALTRAAPTPGGRFLRGGRLTLASRLSLGVFRYCADGAPAGAVLLAEFAGPLRAPGAGITPGIIPRVVRFDGRTWCGFSAWLPLAGGRLGAEAARDPDGRLRHVVAVERGEARGVKLLLSHCGGAAGFESPLGLADDNRAETALLVRARLARRLAGEMEIRGAVEAATSRRSWDRPVGAGRVRLEASPGGGWSLAAETRLESRGAPGPSAVTDPPVRRQSASLRAGWERGGSHLRAEWRGGLDIEVPPGETAIAELDDVREVLSIRGRRAIGPRFWIGGGAARFHVSTATLYEERPGGFPPAVTVAGEGGRLHAALGLSLPGLEIGAFGAREDKGGRPGAWSWGAALGVRRS